jgi:thioesterase domain-containing protein
MDAAPTPSGVRVATRALFGRVSRMSAPLIVPMNEAAATPGVKAPALFCVHSIVGIGVSDFLPLARRFTGSVRVYGVQAPSDRMEEEGFGASVSALADLYAAAIVKAHPSGAIVLAGWSAGAAVALEVARSLRGLGREIALLVAIEGAPEFPDAVLRPSDPRYWIGVARNVPAWLKGGRGVEQPLTILLRWTRAFAGRLAGLAKRRDSEAAPRLQRLVSLDRYPAAQQRFMARLYDALMDHVPQPWDGPVVVYEARAVLTLPQYLERWRIVAPHAVQVRLEGNHVSMMTEPWVAHLARDLEARVPTKAPAGEDDPRARREPGARGAARGTDHCAG